MQKRFQEWDESDFPDLGWSNSRFYGFNFPGRQHTLHLSIDYALDGPLTTKSSTHRTNIWTLIPVDLYFYNVSNFEFRLSMGKQSEVYIQGIYRTNERKTPNGKLVQWDYELDLYEAGSLEFAATGFEQRAASDPITSFTSDLDREASFLD